MRTKKKSNGEKRDEISFDQIPLQELYKTYNALYGTPFVRLRKKELWLSHLRSMHSSETLRRAARKLNINTAFKWRHRFLQHSHSDNPAVLSGVVKAAES